MMQTFEINKRVIEYTHKTSRRSRRIRLAVYPGGEIVVTTPPIFSNQLIQQFMVRKAKWILSKYDYLKQFPSRSFANTRQEFLKHKARALILAKERIAFFNAHYQFQPGRISIKNSKSLWGSCSKKGNLNFNYKIALLPPQYADYIIVHELCHLREFNHSLKFWNLVAEKIPDYKSIKTELKQVGLSLP